MTTSPLSRIPQILIILGALCGTSALPAHAEEGWFKVADMPITRSGFSAEVVGGKIYAIGGWSGGRTVATVNEYDPTADTWTEKANMPTARERMASAVVNGRIYVFGGTGSSSPLVTTEEYDPASDTWSTKMAMPTSRLGTSAVALDGKIYVIGGWQGPGNFDFPSVMEVYDPVSDTWETSATPFSNGNLDVTHVNGKIYVVGGTVNSSALWEYDPASDAWAERARMAVSGHFLSASHLNGKIVATGGSEGGGNAVRVYDPETDEWTKALDMPTSRGSHATVVLDGKLYAFGGHTGIAWGSRGTTYATVEVYTPAIVKDPPVIEGWTEKTDMPIARSGFSAEVAGGKIYAIGGWSGGRTVATVSEYDPSADTWTDKAEMPTARERMASAVVNGRIYVFGGTGSSSPLVTTEEYDPASDTWATKTAMPTSRLGTSAVALDGKIHVIGGWQGPGNFDFPSVMEVYDPVSDTWKTSATPFSNGNLGVTSVNGKIYVVGGTVSSSALWEYDPASDAWEKRASMAVSGHFLSASNLNGKIVATGGSEGGGNAVRVYDPETDEWTKALDMPTSRGSHATVTLDGKLFAFGGHTGIAWGSRGTTYATVEVYTPAAVDTSDLDGDGVPNAYEQENGLDQNVDDADLDKDGDGISNIDEFNANPQTMAGKADTDGDNLSDKVESNTGIYVSPADTGTNPVNPDTDGDRLADDVEIDLGTNPTKSDTDDDGFKDGSEIAVGFDPLDAESHPVNPTLIFDLLGNDLTDPEDDGDPEVDEGYGAVFDASEELGFGGGESAFNVFDNSLGGNNNKWCCGDNSDFPESPLWVQATFEEAIVLSHFTIASANDAPERDPRVWEIQGSNDRENFTTIFHQYDLDKSVWDSRNQVAEFRAETHYATPAAYTTIRFKGIKTGMSGGALFQIAELEFFGQAVEAAAFEVREVSRLRVAERDFLQITFPSTPGDVFAVETSSDLQQWAEVKDGVPASDSNTTSYELELAVPIVDNMYVRVRRE